MLLLHLSRSLRRAPYTAAAAILTLALTLGAGASIFALVDAVLLAPPPFADPEALVTLAEAPLDAPHAPPRAVAYATFAAWRERAKTLAALEAFDGTNLTLTHAGSSERISATDVTPGFLTLLGIVPALGRVFSPGDVAQRVIIVSDRFWRSRLASDRSVIGRQILLDGQSYTVIGVLPAGFVFALDVGDIWRPMPLTAALAASQGYRVRVLARLAGGVAAAHLADALNEVSHASPQPARVIATSVTAAIAGDKTPALGMLAGAAFLAVLVACINLAGLLVVSSIDRRRELAVRAALGARPSQIASRLLLETVTLVALGALAGVLLAMWTTPPIAALAFEHFGGVPNREVAVSWRGIAIVSVVALVCACLCAVVPALRAASRSAADVLRRGTTPSARELTLRRVFVTGEVALAFVLLVSMSLLGRTLFDLLRADPGFEAGGVVALQVSLPRTRYPSPERVASFYAALQRALEGRHGPGSVGIVDELPLTGDGGRTPVRMQAAGAQHDAIVRTVTPGYFDVMRIPVRAGRPFTFDDDSEAPSRVVISQSLADTDPADGPTIGRTLLLGPAARSMEIVGVVGDVKHRSLDERALQTVYLSAWQVPSSSSIIVIRSGRPQADAVAAVREEVARLDGNIPVYRVRSMTDVVAASPGVPARRLVTAAFSLFALLALVLSAIGLFGLAAHDVACRRTELALRIALGAHPARIVQATLGRTALMIGVGLALGSVLSMWTVRALGAAAFAGGGPDAASLAVATAVLIATGAAAALPAALRAARMDPLIALRSE